MPYDILLTRLEPWFLKCLSPREFRLVETLAEADGVRFLCPVCFLEAGETAVGVHSVLCWQPHIGQEVTPGPGRWHFDGTGIEDLTLRAGSSSVLLRNGCQAHFFVRGGHVLGA